MSKFKQLVLDTFSTIFREDGIHLEKISEYFDPAYKQYVDDHVLNYEEFVAHLEVLKNVLKSSHITVEHLVEEDDKVVSVHIVDGVKKDGNKVKVKVISFFKFFNDKIILCDELTHPLGGGEADRDLGSRH